MAKQSWIGGYLLLLALMAAGFGGGGALGFHGLSLYLGETSRTVDSAKQAVTMSQNLDAALLAWSFAVLLVLLGLGALLVFLSSLSQDIARSGRGAIDSQELLGLLPEQSKPQ